MRNLTIFLSFIFLLQFNIIKGAEKYEKFDFSKGNFELGINYWSSHSGVAMWKDWNPKIIENDFRKLHDLGIKILRIFPLWDDFQPIKAIRNASGGIVDFRFGESPLPDTYIGQSGISEIMLERLKYLIETGEKYNFSFIISLVTGHMSGRVFTPEALDGLNPLSDPLALKWEISFVKCIVNELKDYKNIIGWGLGNEANCMGGVSKEQAFVWSSLITNTIHSIDNNRPVLSDMHGLSPKGVWSIIDQGEITDVLTTHPYPLFTANCNNEPLNTIRPIMHGIAESTYYRGISGKPVLIEEMGSLGPMLANDEITADFFRAATFSSWAHGFNSSMWWCNSDYDIYTAPYDWNSFESELGIFKSDGSPKPITNEFRKFSLFLNSFPYKQLPKINYDGIALVSNWDQAQSTFILAKQAGFNIDFQYVNQKLKKSNFYLLPSVNGINRLQMRNLMDEVSNGATLYMSINDLHISDFEKYTGLKITTKHNENQIHNLKVDNYHFNLPSPVSFEIELSGANAILKDDKNKIVLSHFQYGKGNVYVLMTPLEEFLSSKNNLILDTNIPLYKIYQFIFENTNHNLHLLTKSNPFLGITEHWINSQKCIAIIINYHPEKINDKILINNNWHINKLHYGYANETDNILNINLEGNEAIVIELSKNI